MTLSEKTVAEKLLHIGAVSFNVQQPYTWSSGLKSPIYCDNRKTLSFPFIRDFIKSEICNIVFEEYSQVASIAAVATAGIAWGAMAADQLKLPFLYVRPRPKEHGMGNQIEGYYEPNQSVVVIEDLVSTGKSSKQVIETLQQTGFQVQGIVSIFTYELPAAHKAFEEAQVSYQSLSNYSALIQVALEKNFISVETFNALLEWHKNPEQWKPVP